MSDHKQTQTDLTPLIPLPEVPAGYDLATVWKSFSKNQKDVISLWQSPEIRHKRQIATKLGLTETYVNDFLNEPKAQEYLRNYALTYEREQIAIIDHITFKEAQWSGNLKGRELYYKRKGLLQKDSSQANVQVNTSGDSKVQIIFNPVRPNADT